MRYFALVLCPLGLMVAALALTRSPRIRGLLPSSLASHLIAGGVLALAAWLLVLELTHCWEPLSVTETTRALFGR